MNFDGALAAADRVAAAVFDARWFTATRMRPPGLEVNAPPVADTAVPPFVFRGSLDEMPRLSPTGMSGRDHFEAQGLGARTGGRLCLTALAADWPWMPASGTLIEAWPGLPGAGVAERLTVAFQPERDGTRRVVLWLNRQPG